MGMEKFLVASLVCFADSAITDTIENTSVSAYYMLSRSIVLYLLLVWLAFMYLCVMNSYSFQSFESFSTHKYVRDDKPKHLISKKKSDPPILENPQPNKQITQLFINEIIIQDSSLSDPFQSNDYLAFR